MCAVLAPTGPAAYTHPMGKSLRDQLLDKGMVKPEDTWEAKRAREIAAQPPPPEKALPPLFEPRPKGRIVDSADPKTKRD